MIYRGPNDGVNTPRSVSCETRGIANWEPFPSTAVIIEADQKLSGGGEGRLTIRSFAATTARCYYCVTKTLLSNFSGARLFGFLNEGQFSTLSPQSATVFPKIGCESGEFRARGVEDVCYI